MIWTHKDKNFRRPINHEIDIIRPYDNVVLWEHNGGPTELAKQHDEDYQKFLEHPVRSKLRNKLNNNTILRPGVSFGWFLLCSNGIINFYTR